MRKQPFPSSTFLALLVFPSALAWGTSGVQAQQQQPDPFRNEAADSKLPSGPGLAAAFENDRGIAAHAGVVFADAFDRAEGEPIGGKWDETGDKDGRVLSLDDGGPDGGQCLKVTATLGRNTGGGLTRWFESSEAIYIRFYTRFDPECDYVHHFCTLRANRGLSGGDKWSGFGGAGELPDGGQRFSTALEPWGNWGRWSPPGRWNFYSYWSGMKAAPDGKFWGNSFLPEEQPEIRRGEWICAEFMLKHNTPGQTDGEQAFWIDGKLRGHWRGIAWRTDEALRANAFTLESYITDRWTKHPENVVWFDNVVVARSYVGPLRGDAPAKGAEAKSFSWTSDGQVLSARDFPGLSTVSVKDPTVVRHEGKWHLFATIRGRERSHAVVYLAFDEWEDAGKAERHILPMHPGYFCAPQVFWFTPHRKWYLVCQASDPAWSPEYQAAYAVSDDLSRPDSWSPLRPLSVPHTPDDKAGLDFWVVCDVEKAHLFLSTLDGRLHRSETALADFPSGWSRPVVAIEGDIFEASHTYSYAPGPGSPVRYLTLMEAQNGHGWRYYKAWTADRLDRDGAWKPLADTKENAFASMKNVSQTGASWTDNVSHGELLRAGNDETLPIAPADGMTFLIQGVTEADRAGKDYGAIPWKLGLLRAVSLPPLD